MVKWSPVAKADLKEIYAFIKKDSQFYAQKVANEIIAKSEALETFPNMGRVVEELNDPNLREIIAFSYRLIYQVSIDGIEIVALVHSRRNHFPSCRCNGHNGGG